MKAQERFRSNGEGAIETVSHKWSKRESDAAGDFIHLFLAGLAMFAYFASLSVSLRDGDTSWHIAAGEWIIKHRAIPSTDPFSYTFLGKPWAPHEWLSEVFMYAAWQFGGWPAILVMFAALGGLLIVTLTLYVRRWMPFPTALIPVSLCFVGLLSHCLARPHIFGWTMLAIWLVGLLRARDLNRAPSLWMALLMVFWANLHGSFLLGLALIAPLALEALLAAERENRVQVFTGWAPFALISLIASLATPQGIDGLIFPLFVSAMKTLPYISEWKATDFAEISVFEFVLLTGLFFCLYKPVRVPVLRLLVLLGFLHFAFAHSRHQPIFLILSCLLLASPLAVAYRPEAGEDIRPVDLSRLFSPENLPLIAVMFALASGVSISSAVLNTQRPDSYGVPQKAIANIPSALRNKPVLNEYSFGGTLIQNGIPVYIDGRADVYGDTFITDYVKMIEEGDLKRWDVARRKWDIQWTILPPDKPLVKWLDHQPDWIRVYADKWAVIQARKSALDSENQSRTR